MAKSIKKTWKYLIVIVGIIILLPALLAYIVSFPDVQTFIMRRITENISTKIKSTIAVGRVEYTFPNKLILNDLIIKDRNQDTLLYSSRISAGIRRIDIRRNIVRINRVIVNNPVVGFITDSTGVMNLTWYLDLIRNPEDTLKKKNNISINQIDISNGRFSLVNRTSKIKDSGIDFNNLHLTKINGILEDFRTGDDSTGFSIYNLAFRESKGFSVQKMSGDMTLADHNILFSPTIIYLDSSVLNIDHLGILPDSSGSFENFVDNVKLDLLLNESLISNSDLQYFVPPVKGINEYLNLSGQILGTVSELKGRNIMASYGRNTNMDCDFDLSGLPDIDNTFIYIGINNLKIDTDDINNISIRGKGNIDLPEILYKLGGITFNGNFTGFTTDFVTYGKITTDAGSVTTDVSFRPEESNRYKIKGIVTGTNIALGLLTGEEDLIGSLSMHTNVDMYASSLKDFSGNLTGLIDSVDIKDYKYRDISLNGIFSDKTWDGSVKISDKNIKMDLLGLFDFSDELPEFDFTLNLHEADLLNLKIVEDTTTEVSLLLTANFKGNNFDNLDGEIKLLNSNIIKGGNNLEFYDFSLKTFTENNKPAISLRTDYIDADLRGYYSFTGLGTVVKSTMSRLMPSRFPESPPEKEPPENSFIFNISFKNTDKINNFFDTRILLAEKSTINGSVFPDSIIQIRGETSTLNFRNNIFKDLSIEAVSISPDLSVTLKTSSLGLFGTSELKGFMAQLNTEPDNFTFSLNWDNHEEIRNRGDFIARGTFIRNDSAKQNPLLKIDIDPTDIYNRNNLWKIDRSQIILDSNAVDIERLRISHEDHFYHIDGAISEDPSDTLHLEFKGIDISPVNYLLGKKDDPDKLSLKLRGILEGNILLTNIYKNTLIEGNFGISDFSVLESNFGDLSVVSAWNSETTVADIRAGTNRNGKKLIDIEGSYDPEAGKLDLNAQADHLPVEALNSLLDIFASDINGTASGKVKLSGESGNLVLKGALFAENTSMKIDFLQTRYTMNDSIRFDKNNIIFRNIRLLDEKGNNATLNGSVFHDYFKNYRADLLINTDKCMVLNTKPRDNDIFYGTAYATGVTTIKSGTNSLSFDISAKTDRNTKIYIPLNSSETVSDYSFITFVSHDTISEPGNSPSLIPREPDEETAMELNFDLEITPDAEIQLIFDSKVGDIMQGRGSGNLNISLNSRDEFGISGDYIIDAGDYLFTLGNILNKPFTVENGGKITFNGNIDDAEIDIKAIYKLRASLYEILQDERYNERIPVECQIDLSGKLFNPVIGLDIFLPTADESTRTYLKNVITTEEERSRQFLYLLVMNSFYSDPTYRSTLTSNSSPATGTSAMAVTTTEMVSNQLSNWLSQISNDFDIGFVYRPGYKDISSNEVQLALSTQLLNDKVVINGNFDVRGTGGTSDNTNQLSGDFDIEYKITDRIRFKVFNRFNNPYTGKQAPYTQGFGLFYRQEFDKFSDLFRRTEKSEMKKEEEPAVSDI